MTKAAPFPTSKDSGLGATRTLAELSTADVSYAGSKGANLGQLTRTGLPAPAGFVVGAPAYAAYRLETGLVARLQELLGDLNVEDTAKLRYAAVQARQAVLEREMPYWLADEVCAAYDELTGAQPDAPVAVRSSAVGEDAAARSLAGLNETILNVCGPKNVIDAVTRCWISLFDARTIYHRAQSGCNPSLTDIAVVVQRQIASTRAGVMFTVGPASDNDGHLLIEGSFGLGQAAVSGQVSPDRYVVDKPSMTILRRAEKNRRQVLTDDEVLRLTELGSAVEREYGAPQEIGWAFDPQGSIWLLQIRPIALRRRLELPSASG